MSVNMCSIPKKQDGEYYCPYCNFSSYDIEDSAIAMCWDCVFNDESKEENILLPTEEAQENRRIAISALVNNPAKYTQITQMHRNTGQGRCATGLMAEIFHIPMPTYNSSTVNHRLNDLVGDFEMASTVIAKNDHNRMSFTAIAQYLAIRWGIDINTLKEENN